MSDQPGSSSKDSNKKKYKMRCYYEVLEVEKTATAEELKNQYRKLAKQWHPGMSSNKYSIVSRQFLINNNKLANFIPVHFLPFCFWEY